MRAEPEQTRMLIEERRQHILSLVEKEGRVLVDELSTRLKLSRITIRKDLDYLESKELLLRTHGGALPVQASALRDVPVQQKAVLHHAEKSRIAQAAAAMISEGQCVLLDSGSTTTAIAQALLRFHQLTVITNALNIAAALATSNFEIILIGGTVRKHALSVVGPIAEEVLKEMHADIVFLGVDGFDVKMGLTAPNMPEARVNRAMVKAAEKVVAVCDSSKFERRSMALIVAASEIHHVITGKEAGAETIKMIEAAGIAVTIV